MSHKSHDIFLLMLNLYQFKTSDKIIDFFLDAVHNMWEQLTFRFEPIEKKDSANEPGMIAIIDIATQKRYFGAIEISGSSPGENDLALIRNAGRILAIILENREQEVLLANEKKNLELKVRDRTNELLKLNEALRQRMDEQKQLESQLIQSRKLEAVGTLAGGIAHDFNNILGAVVGYTELALHKSEKNSKIHYYLQQALKASHKASETVSQILTFSHKSKPEIKPVHLGSIIEGIIGLLRSSIPTSIDIVTNLEDCSTVVLANPAQMEQVVVNLCANAADAMQGNTKNAVMDITLADVTIGPGADAEFTGLKEGNYLKLSVGDTGPGIGPQVVNRVFEPFFTTSEAIGRSGMGLSVVHGIVKSSGGEIKLKSLPGKGTTVDILLPAIEAEESVPGKSAALQTASPLEGKNEQVLFVDDEEALVDIGRQMLSEFGYRVSATASSREALEIFKNSPELFHLIITDQTMPHMTGVDLAKEVRETRPDIPVILCSGYSDNVNIEYARDNGIRAFIKKPYTQTNILKAIRDVLD